MKERWVLKQVADLQLFVAGLRTRGIEHRVRREGVLGDLVEVRWTISEKKGPANAADFGFPTSASFN